MATLGEMKGGRDGFSCSRPIFSSRDKESINQIVKEEQENEDGPSSKRATKKFRYRRD